jgi:hypothetical protein
MTQLPGGRRNFIARSLGLFRQAGTILFCILIVLQVVKAAACEMQQIPAEYYSAAHVGVVLCVPNIAIDYSGKEMGRNAIGDSNDVWPGSTALLVSRLLRPDCWSRLVACVFVTRVEEAITRCSDPDINDVRYQPSADIWSKCRGIAIVLDLPRKESLAWGSLAITPAGKKVLSKYWTDIGAQLLIGSSFGELNRVVRRYSLIFDWAVNPSHFFQLTMKYDGLNNGSSERTTQKNYGRPFSKAFSAILAIALFTIGIGLSGLAVYKSPNIGGWAGLIVLASLPFFIGAMLFLFFGIVWSGS